MLRNNFTVIFYARLPNQTNLAIIWAHPVAFEAVRSDPTYCSVWLQHSSRKTSDLLPTAIQLRIPKKEEVCVWTRQTYWARQEQAKVEAERRSVLWIRCSEGVVCASWPARASTRYTILTLFTRKEASTLLRVKTGALGGVAPDLLLSNWIKYKICTVRQSRRTRRWRAWTARWSRWKPTSKKWCASETKKNANLNSSSKTYTSKSTDCWSL